MAETVVLPLVKKILEKLRSIASQQIALVKRELEKLERTMSNIGAVVLDAEEKQTENRQLSAWLEKLKDVCYDAEDVLDELVYEGLRQKMAARGILKTKVHVFFSNSSFKFRYVLVHKIKEIQERLDEIEAVRTRFHLTVRPVESHVMQREISHPFLYPDDITDRSSVKDSIIERLIDEDFDSNLSVIPIVGIGGIGKSTVAQLVFKDERVLRCFDLKIWISVSDDFVLEKLVKDILRCIGEENCNRLPLDELQFRLRKSLQSRKFLLVLDDVWAENPGKWLRLRELLLDNGAKGNKIIVTTRSLLVADIMGTVTPYLLQGLSDDECWSLFMKCAFKEGQEELPPELVLIGRELVRKCRGVPLAVRSLGAMLYGNPDEQAWLHVLDNGIWRLEDTESSILGSLRLSYEVLPSYLKQCFYFCSLFPKGYVFNNHDLIRLWDAQGFLHHSNEIEDAEDIGNIYIQQLISRFFFEYVDTRGSYINFKIHDLLHDLALFVARKECLIFSIDGNIYNQIQHVSFCNWDLQTEDVKSFLLGLNKLRTILSPILEGSTYEFPVETCIIRFKALQCLDLRYSSFEVLPSSIGKLKNLKYLNLSWNCAIKSLPNSLCKLLNLRYLLLRGCSNLKELPKDIGNLISLRSLCFTTNQMDLHLENGIGQLSLRELSIYDCKDLSSWGKGIQHSTAIRRLELSRCPSLVSLPCSLKYLLALKTLVISNCEKLNLEGEDGIQFSKSISLQYVSLSYLPEMKNLPTWLATNNLKYLKIADCENLIEVSGLQSIVSLQKLEISGCRSLSKLPLLPSRTELVVKECPLLRVSGRRERGKDGREIAGPLDISSSQMEEVDTYDSEMDISVLIP